MNKLINRLLAIIVAAVMVSCGANSDNRSRSHNVDNPNLREVMVIEVIQTSSYTYLKMEEVQSVYWGAIPRRDDIEEGGTYYFDNWMEMKNFQSKELDRTFESIYFIQVISDQPFAAAQQQPTATQGSSKVGNMEIGPVDPVEGGITIEDLLASIEDYRDKTVKIRGVVVKYTPAVMQRNWVHIQDGSHHEGNFDLTITTTDQVEKGVIATFEGKIILDKDFGYGYSYEVLMEDAILLAVEKDNVLQ